MYNEYIEYQENLRKHSRQKYAMVLWGFLLVNFLMLTVIGILAVLPMGIILGVGCAFYFVFFVKRWKRCSATWRKIKEYRSDHKRSMIYKKGATYCFLVPFSTLETLNMLHSTLSAIGEVKSVDTNHGELAGKIRISKRKKIPIVFYVERSTNQCRVRACFRRLACDDWWDLFLYTLFEKYPESDFGVALAKGDPVIAGVLNLSGDTCQKYYSTTTGGQSLGGFLVGKALFGDAGAIVGGMSGKKHTVTTSCTAFSNQLLVRLILSNGRIWEGKVGKGSPLYNEIMVMM